MPLFKPHTIICDISPEKAEAVISKITGEYGKIIRESYDLKPFTGSVKEKKFKLIPNHSQASIKLKGSIQNEGLRSTRIELTGHFLTGKLLLFILLMGSVGLALGIISVTLLMTESVLFGSLSIFFPILVVWQLYHLVLGYPRSQYNQASYELMRKLDLHEYVI
jgi:hypothetical protein